MHQDVSSKSYDRWTYMPEKRAGMDLWNDGSRACWKGNGSD
jgi:hypothetical protein